MFGGHAFTALMVVLPDGGFGRPCGLREVFFEQCFVPGVFALPFKPE